MNAQTKRDVVLAQYPMADIHIRYYSDGVPASRFIGSPRPDLGREQYDALSGDFMIVTSENRLWENAYDRLIEKAKMLLAESMDRNLRESHAELLRSAKECSSRLCDRYSCQMNVMECACRNCANARAAASIHRAELLLAGEL